MRRVLAVIAISICVAAPLAADTVGKGSVIVSPDSNVMRDQVDTAWRRALEYIAAGRRRFFDTTPESSPNARYRVNIVASLDPGSETTVVTMSRSGEDNGVSMPLMGPLDDIRAQHLANAILYLWGSYNGYFEDQREKPPELLEVIPYDAIGKVAKPALNYPVYAGSVGFKSNGNAVIGFSTFSVELNSVFGTVGYPGSDLEGSGANPFAYQVGITPADTIYFKPSTGSDLYRSVLGAPRSQKVRTGMNLAVSSMAVLPDGSVVLHDGTRQETRRIEGRKSYPLDLKSRPESYIFGMAAGPAGNIWVYDLTEFGFRSYSPEGAVVNAMKPLVDVSAGFAPMSFDVDTDGSIVAFSSGKLWKFDREGFPLWEIDSTGTLDPFPISGIVSLDTVNDRIYLLDSVNRNLFVFLNDPSPDPFERRLSDLNRELSRDPDSTEVLQRKAEYLQDNGSFILAKASWESVLDIDPYNDTAAEASDAIDVMVLSSLALEQAQVVFDTLDALGPESARLSYMQTIQLYERILSIDPTNDEERARMRHLQEEFTRRSAVPSGRTKPIDITSIDIDEIFPALIRTYVDRPIGKVVVKNTLDETVHDVRVKLILPRFTDAAVDGDVLPRLESGEEITVALMLLLNDTALTLQEDLPMAATVVVEYRTGNEHRQVAKNKTVTVHRKSALTWDRTERLSSFVTPNEEVISSFALRVLNDRESEGSWLPDKIRDAARISDAVGVYGIRYVEDPNVPISGILGNAGVIDTVRFPRRTLQVKAGDCDDTTALLCSLFESSGIKTALMTSPGHIFMAFDTGEPASNAWLYGTDNLITVEEQGTVWIPIETTVLSEGFVKSWQAASELIVAHADEIDFLPLSAHRSEFPALPLPPSSFAVAEPAEDRIDELNNPSLSAMRTLLYQDGIDELEAKRKQAQGKKALNYANRIAILHARFGEYEEAEQIFEANIEREPGYIASYVNLTNLQLLLGREREALGTLVSGLDKQPDSVSLNLLAARTHYRLGNPDESQSFFHVVEQRDPELAGRFAYLGSSDAGARAGAPDAAAGFTWYTSEE